MYSLALAWSKYTRPFFKSFYVSPLMERISRLELQIHPHVRKMIRENELTEHFITFMLSVYLAESKRAEYLELLMVQRH